MSTLLKDAATLFAIAVIYSYASGYTFHGTIGEYLTHEVILGVPLFGVLVRYRLHCVAQANERSSRCSREVARDEVQDGVEDVCQGISYPAMFRRTYRIEGFAGLYKGMVPALIPFVVSKIVLPLVYLVLELFVEDPYNINIIPENYKGDIIRSVIWVLGYLPVYVLSIRSITVTQRIPFRTSPFRAMRTLFTPTELSHPTAFLPLVRGVGACLLLRRLYAVFIYADIHMWIASWVSLATGIPNDPAEFIPEGYTDFMPTKEMAISFGMLVTTSVLVHIGTAVLICPLEVIAMRLTAQRVYEASCGADKNGEEEADKDVLFDVEDQRNVQKETDETPEPESSEISRPETASPVAFMYERFIAA